MDAKLFDGYFAPGSTFHSLSFKSDKSFASYWILDSGFAAFGSYIRFQD